MSTIFIVSMVLGKGRLDSCLLLVLVRPCCLGQLLDLWLTNSEIFFALCCILSCFIDSIHFLTIFFLYNAEVERGHV